MKPRFTASSVRRAFLVTTIAWGVAGTCAAPAAEMTARDVTIRLRDAAAAAPANFSGKDLARLDLSNLDFRGAILSRSDLFGADLTGAVFQGSDLAGANLDRVTLIGANFDRARLDGASLLRPSAFSTLTPTAAEAPSFKGSSMRGIRLFGRFSRSDFSGADLTEATCAPFGKTGFIEEIWRTELAGANLSGALLARANLTHALLSFADLSGADLRGVVLKNADLTGADLRGANLAGADVTGADLSGVRVEGATGFDAVIGLAAARNAEKIIR